MILMKTRKSNNPIDSVSDHLFYLVMGVAALGFTLGLLVLALKSPI